MKILKNKIRNLPSITRNGAHDAKNKSTACEEKNVLVKEGVASSAVGSLIESHEFDRDTGPAYVTPKVVTLASARGQVLDFNQTFVLN